MHSAWAVAASNDVVSAAAVMNIFMIKNPGSAGAAYFTFFTI
jgi:hypothetical protein